MVHITHGTTLLPFHNRRPPTFPAAPPGIADGRRGLHDASVLLAAVCCATTALAFIFHATVWYRRSAWQTFLSSGLFARTPAPRERAWQLFLQKGFWSCSISAVRHAVEEGCSLASLSSTGDRRKVKKKAVVLPAARRAGTRQMGDGRIDESCAAHGRWTSLVAVSHSRGKKQSRNQLAPPVPSTQNADSSVWRGRQASKLQKLHTCLCSIRLARAPSPASRPVVP